MQILDKTINKDIPVPLYYQLKELLREQIRNSGVGDAIPTEIELCEHFGISRPTVRQAISELVAEGYLHRSKGKGTFVHAPKIRRDFLLVLESFNKEMKNKGFNPGTKLITLTKIFPDGLLSEKLMIPVSSEMVFIRRLRFTDNIPLMVVNSYLPAKMLPGIEKYDLENNSLHGLLQNEFGYEFGRAVRTIEALPAKLPEAELLDIKPGTPVQFLETLIFLTDGTPIKYARAWYRGDRCRFTYELTKDHPKSH
jgi:GntR family transcriptional regulator